MNPFYILYSLFYILHFTFHMGYHKKRVQQKLHSWPEIVLVTVLSLLYEKLVYNLLFLHCFECGYSKRRCSNWIHPLPADLLLP